MEIARPVVPPRVDAVGVVHRAEHVDETPPLERLEPFAFRLAHVRRTDELRGVVHVSIGGRDVEVATDEHRGRRFGVGVEVGHEPVEPRQLVRVVRIVERSPVGDVDAADAHAATGRGDDAGIGIGVDVAGEVDHHVVEADLREDRHPVPLPLPVVRARVAQRLERQRRERVVGEFRLLQHDDVGRRFASHSSTRS